MVPIAKKNQEKNMDSYVQNKLKSNSASNIPVNNINENLEQLIKFEKVEVNEFNSNYENSFGEAAGVHNNPLNYDISQNQIQNYYYQKNTKIIDGASLVTGDTIGSRKMKAKKSQTNVHHKRLSDSLNNEKNSIEVEPEIQIMKEEPIDLEMTVDEEHPEETTVDLPPSNIPELPIEISFPKESAATFNSSIKLRDINTLTEKVPEPILLNSQLPLINTVSTFQNTIRKSPVIEQKTRTISNKNENIVFKNVFHNDTKPLETKQLHNNRRTKIRVLSVNQVVPADEQSLSTFSTTKPVHRNSRNVSYTKRIPNINKKEKAILKNKNDTHSLLSKIAMKMKTESDETTCCILCAKETTSPCSLTRMIVTVEEVVGVKISTLNRPLLSCQECLLGCHAALELRQRAQAAYKIFMFRDKVKELKTLSESVPDDFKVGKVMRTYGKTYKNKNESQQVQDDSAYLKKNETSNIGDCATKFIEENNLENNLPKPDTTQPVLSSITIDLEEEVVHSKQATKLVPEKSEKEKSKNTINNVEITQNELAKNNENTSCECNIPFDISCLDKNQLRTEFLKEIYTTTRCLRCFQWFSTASELNEHIMNSCSMYITDQSKQLEKRKVELLTCRLCHLVLRSQLDLETHAVFFHLNNACPDCTLTFAHKGHLIKHQAKHENVPTVRCGYCSRPVSVQVFEDHIIFHGTQWLMHRRKQCSKCKIMYELDTKVYKEIVRNKEGYVCDVCGLFYKSIAMWRKHLLKHRRGVKCTICYKLLGSPQTLERHMSIHTGVRPFSCKYCPKSFSVFWNCVQHERVHTNTKPYECEVCKEKFIYHVSRKRHMTMKHSTNEIKVAQESNKSKIKEKKNGNTKDMTISTKTRKRSQKKNAIILDKEKNVKVQIKKRRIFRCNLCNLLFANSNIRAKHLKTKHNIAIDVDMDKGLNEKHSVKRQIVIAKKMCNDK